MSKLWKLLCCKGEDSVDPANWMGQLSAAARKIPLNLLAIPGSHDSGTYAITEKSGIAPDLEPFLRKLVEFLGVLAKFVISKWSLTQTLNFTEQLMAGIRYLDIRVALDTTAKPPAFYIVHGMYSIALLDGLQQVVAFLNSHPTEVVLLDFNHFYAMTAQDHKQLKQLIKLTFGGLLAPTTYINNFPPSLNYLRQVKQQVIAFYHDTVNPATEPFWDGSTCPSLWPNTTDPQTMVDYNESRYATARSRPGDFLVCQGILTPNSTVIVQNLGGSLKVLADKAGPPFVKWLEQKRVGQASCVNIFIVDFVQNYAYIDTVLRLNDDIQ